MSDQWRPFMLRRTEEGDVARQVSGPTVYTGYLRYGPRVVVPEEVSGTGLLALPYLYESALVTVQVSKTVDWTQAVLVRGGFGFPTTPMDGVQIWYTNTKPIDIDTSQEVLDTPLTPGNWYYYTLFLWIGGQWILSAQVDVLVPKNYGHSELLFGWIPPFYQKMDTDYAVDGRRGALQLFASILGYDLDLTRTFVDGILNIYSPDKVPYRLLRYLGDNQGFPYENELGASRFRSVIEQLDDLNNLRGTVIGLERLITAASDYDCEAAIGKNMLLSVDDSEFVGPGSGVYYPSDPEYVKSGVGLWGNMAIVSLADALVAPDGVNHPASVSTPQFVKGTDATVTPPSGRGYLVVESITDADIVLSCGVYDNTTLPLFKAIPVKAGSLYDFQAQVRRTALLATSDVWLGVYWFGEAGDLASYISYSIGPNQPDNSDSSSAWLHVDVQFFAPSTTASPPATADAFYAVPYVWWHTTGPTSQAFPAQGHLLASVMFSEVTTVGAAVAPLPPDVYLTLGATSKLLGDPAYYLGDQVSS